MNGPRERVDRARETALILGKAASRVERGGWATGPLARAENQKACVTTTTEARYWSARGAILKELAGRRLKPSTEDVILRSCLEALAAEIRRQDGTVNGDARLAIDDWNDRAGQTARSVAETLADSVRNI